MAEPLKNIYSPSFFEGFTRLLKETLPGFREQAFLNSVFDHAWEGKELKQRMRHIALSLREQLPAGFAAQAAAILRLVEALRNSGVPDMNFQYMFLPDIIELSGLEEPVTALDTMEVLTAFTSCEFAIRPFLLRYPEPVMQHMLEWSRQPHPFVRRFASEGCRPRLPWAVAIPALKRDPSPILPLLENLKNDPSLFVRKSVANNLNDISKDHPGIVAELARRWKGESAETDWIVRHGCRTLLKKAHPGVYSLYQLDSAVACTVSELSLSGARVKIGDKLGFSFTLSPSNGKAQRIRLEYAIHYVRAKGGLSRKLFKLAESTYHPGSSYTFRRQQHFGDLSTRKHYPGPHRLGIVVNGKELATTDFVVEA